MGRDRAATSGHTTSQGDPTVAGPRRRGRPRKLAAERDEGNRRRDVVDAAAKLFRKQGFDATTTRDIAAAAGMQAGSPFYHFKNKNELLYEVMKAGMQLAIARLRVMPLPVSDAEAALRRLVRLHLETLFGPGHDFIPVMLYEWRSLDGHQRKVIAAAQRDYEALWTPVLQALAEQGRLRCDLHLARLLIFGALNWSVHWFDKRKRASLDEIAEAAVMLFLQPPSPAPRRSTTRTSHVVEPPPPKTNSIPSRS